MRTLIVALAMAVLAPAAWAQEKTDAESLLRRAAELEAQGDGGGAVKAYMRAARGGSAPAARRLAEIYEKGQLGIKHDHAESLKWAGMARTLGEKNEGGWGCPPKCRK